MNGVAPAVVPEIAPLPTSAAELPGTLLEGDNSNFETLLDLPMESGKEAAPLPPPPAPAEPAAIEPAPSPTGVAPAPLDGKDSSEISDEQDAPDDEKSSTASTEQPVADATFLSSQLAMWQILPRPIEPVPVVVPKVAEPDASSVDVEAKISPGNFDQISVATPQPLPTEITPSATPISAPTPEPKAEQTVATPPPATPAPAIESVAKPAAEISPKRLPAKSAARVSEAAKPASDKDVQLAEEVIPKARINFNGIPVAKQQRVMSERNLPSTATPAPAGFAGPNPPVKATGEIAAAAGSSGHNSPQDQPREEANRQPQTSATAATSAEPERAAHTTVTKSEFPAPVHATDTTKVIDQIERAVERLRTQGGQRMEMRLPLQEGGEVVVKLQVNAGEVKAFFRTESTGLRDALEAGWNQFAAGSTERSLKVAAAVFESPSAQSGMSSFTQTPDQRSRQQAFAQAENAASTNATFRLPSKTTTTTDATLRPTVAAPAASGMKLYA